MIHNEPESLYDRGAATPAEAPAEVARAASVGTAAPLTGTPPRNTSLVVFAAVGISLAGILGLLVLGYLILGLGPGGFAIAGVLALIPLAIVLLGVRWIDRWEPEPKPALIFAFLWGSGVAVFVALVVGLGIETVIEAVVGKGAGADFVSSVIQAPVVEESAKGFGLLLILLVARKHFDSAVDGVVYAAVVAGGFAFTENILYFAQQLADGSGIVGLFVIRGLMSPFAHVMFTACTGIALGWAARRAGTLGAIGAFIVGLIPAMLLHALWNGSLYFVDNFFAYYAVVQLPLFVGAVLLVVFLRRKEARLTQDRLTEYAAAGWFAPGEVTALATREGRRQAKVWAGQRGLGAVMNTYTRDATRLAFTRQRIVTGRATTGAQAEERALLESIVQSRSRLQAPRP